MHTIEGEGVSQVSSDPRDSTLDMIKRELEEVRKKVVRLESLLNKLQNPDPTAGSIGAENQVRAHIVDDDTDVRQFLCHLCEFEGYKDIEAERGREALICIEEGRADLMFLDLNLRGGSGVELLRILRRRGLDIPTIVISGYVSAETTQQLLELGVDRIVAKPFNTSRILGEVRKALGIENVL